MYKNKKALETFKRTLNFLPDSIKNYRQDYRLSLYYLQNSQLDSAAHYLVKSIEGGFLGDLKYDVRFDSLQVRSKMRNIEPF